MSEEQTDDNGCGILIVGFSIVSFLIVLFVLLALASQIPFPTLP